MLKLFKLPFPKLNLLFFFIEAASFFGVVCLAVGFRFAFNSHELVDYFREEFFRKAFLVLIVYQLILYYHDLMYHGECLRRRGMAILLFQATVLTALVLAILYYWSPNLSLGRGIFFFMMPMLLGVSAVLRLIYLRLTENTGRGEKVLILGSEGLARHVGEEIMNRPDLGYRIMGFIDKDPSKIGKSVLNPKVIGSYKNMSQIIEKEKIQIVIVALSEKRGELPVQDLLHSKLHGVKVLDGISFYEGLAGKIAVEELKPSWLIFSDGFGRPASVLITKRSLDIGFSILGLTLMLPLFPIVALFIKLSSPGPIFYSQERVGEKGKLMTILKFRSMRADAEDITGPAWAQEDDPRVTWIGRILRKTRIDELPQLWNVLRGDMSFVGPRPERPTFVEELEKEIPFYSTRLSVKPGITGWAQIRYQYGSSIEDTVEKMQYDLYYIKNMSILFDLMIIFQTIKTVLLRRGAR